MARPLSPKNEIVRLLEANTGAKRMLTVWSDWCEMMAITFSNTCDMAHYTESEARYLQIAGQYDAGALGRFAQALAALVNAVDQAGFADVLGDAYGQLELGNADRGQFFTPYSLCQAMARMTIEGPDEDIAAQGYITVSDPACGAGALLIAAAETLKDAGHNHQRHMHATAIDIDPTAVHMAYVQLTLLGVPAVVLHGDTLRGVMWDTWYTPAHMIDGWSWRLCNKPSPAMQIGAVLAGIEQNLAGQPATMQLPLFATV